MWMKYTVPFFFFFLIKSLFRSVFVLLCCCCSLSCQASRWRRAPCALQSPDTSSRKIQKNNNFLDPELKTQQGLMSSVLSKSLDMKMFSLVFLPFPLSFHVNVQKSDTTNHPRRLVIWNNNVLNEYILPAGCPLRQSLCWGLHQDHLQGPWRTSGSTWVSPTGLWFHLLFPSLPKTSGWCSWGVWGWPARCPITRWAGLSVSRTCPMCTEGIDDLKALDIWKCSPLVLICYQQLHRHILDSTYMPSPLHVEKVNQPGSHHHQKVFGRWKALVPSERWRKKSGLLGGFFKDTSFYVLFLPAPPHNGYLNALCYGIWSVWIKRRADATICLMPSRFPQLVLQQWVSKCIWQRCQTGNTGVCSPSLVCARGKRAEVAAYFCPETSCSWSTSSYSVSENIMQKNKKEQIWFSHTCFYDIIENYLTNLGCDYMKLHELLHILQILHRFNN